MNNLSSIRYLGIFALLGVASCSTNHSALKGEADDLYFMASDAEVATEFAVKNNNPENFRQLEEIKAEEYDQENFSAKNVNPEYIAKYQSNNNAAEEGTVYFDDAEGDAVQGQDGDINIYNNFRGYNARDNNSGWNMNPWMMRSMYMGGLSPFGMGGFYDPFYDPFWGSGFGFRPGLSLSLGMGFGMGSRMWNPMMRHGYGMGGFYDPFYSPYMGYGYGMNYYNRPIVILPGGSENQRQIVRGNRPSRSSYLATGRSRATGVATPGSSRATARREAVSRNSRTSTPSTRANSRSDFSRSQNDFYNGTTRGSSAASAAPSSRNINSPAMSRAGSTSNRNTYATPERRTTRTQAPSNVNTRRSSSDTRSRYAAPSRSTSPSYNRSSSPQYRRSTTPTNNNRSNYSTPSRTRSSSPSYSAPSRSSGSSGGEATRSSGGSSRRGN
jgi:hypothetical protein